MIPIIRHSGNGKTIIWHSGNGKTIEMMIEKWVAAKGEREEKGMNTHITGDFPGNEDILYGIMMVNIKPIKCTTRRGEVHSEL